MSQNSRLLRCTFLEEALAASNPRWPLVTRLLGLGLLARRSRTMAEPIPSTNSPVEMSPEDFRARQEAGQPGRVGPQRREDPGGPAGLSRTPDRSVLAQGSPYPGLLNLTAGSDQRPCGAPAPRTGLHGGPCPARWFRCMASGRLSGQAEGHVVIRRDPRSVAMSRGSVDRPASFRVLGSSSFGCGRRELQ